MEEEGRRWWEGTGGGARWADIQRKPVAQPQRWPRKLAEGMKMEMSTAMTRGVIHVGTL